MTFRSTRGASKQRRDQISTLVSQLRELLPLPETTTQRLSQIQVMSMTCAFIRKDNYLRALFGSQQVNEQQSEFMQSLPGFLLAVAEDGKLVYISDNVTDYLGHSMVDMMAQGESFWDIVDSRDHAGVQARLTPGWAGAGAYELQETSFCCRMNAAKTLRRPCNVKEQKSMLVRGNFVSLKQPHDCVESDTLFVGLCSPLPGCELRGGPLSIATDGFWMEHSPDMKIIACSPRVEQYLGACEEQLTGKSWYQLLHPENLAEAKQTHVRVLKQSSEHGVMLVSRMQTSAGEWQAVISTVWARASDMCSANRIISFHCPIRPEEVALMREECARHSEQVATQLASSGTMLPLPTYTAVPSRSSPAPRAQLKRKLPPRLDCRPFKMVKIAQPGVDGQSFSQASDQQSFLSLLKTETENWMYVAADGRGTYLPPTPEASDVDIDDVLSLPTIKQESCVPQGVCLANSPAWIPPTPSPQPHRIAKDDHIPMVDSRHLPQMGVDEIIDFFEEVKEEREEKFIPTTISDLLDNAKKKKVPTATLR